MQVAFANLHLQVCQSTGIAFILLSFGWGDRLRMSNKFTRFILIAMALGVVMGALVYDFLPQDRADIASSINLIALLFLRTFPAPQNGQGLNPVLQDPGLAFHPPFLYLGYVGFSVAFAFAVAALIEGRVDAAWARPGRGQA